MDYINKIRTADGDKPVNYEALANKPLEFTGASDTSAGKKGFVPAPVAGDNTKFLSGDGTWKEAVTPKEVIEVIFSTHMPAGTTGCNKTYAEIIAAILAGKKISATFNGSTMNATAAGERPLYLCAGPVNSSSTTPIIFIGAVGTGTSPVSYYLKLYAVASGDTVTEKTLSF